MEEMSLVEIEQIFTSYVNLKGNTNTERERISMAQ